MVAITAISATGRGRGGVRRLNKRGHRQCISPVGNQGQAFPSSTALKIVTTSLAWSLEEKEPSLPCFLSDLKSHLPKSNSPFVSQGRMLRTEEAWLLVDPPSGCRGGSTGLWLRDTHTLRSLQINRRLLSERHLWA